MTGRAVPGGAPRRTPGKSRAARGARLAQAGATLRQPSVIGGSRAEPVRTCVGCRGRDRRSVLLRVVAAEDGGVWSAVPDPGRRLPGRGASVHPVPRCLDLAERRRAFARALRRSGSPDLTALAEYVAEIADHQAPSTPEAGLTLMSTR